MQWEALGMSCWLKRCCSYVSSRDTKRRLTGCSSSSYCGAVDWTLTCGLAASEVDECSGFWDDDARQWAGVSDFITSRRLATV